MSTAEYARYREWKGWNKESFGTYLPNSAIYFSRELRRSGVDSVDGATILEIGFGNGEFAAWARDAGAKYVGTERIHELVQQGVRAGYDVRDANEPLDEFLAEESVDLIVAFDVFEHFEEVDLRRALRSAHRALRPAGRLIARVPSGDSPFARSIQHGDVTHRLAIGSSMIQQFADEASFSVHCVREPEFPLLGLGAKTFLRRAAVRGIRTLVFPFLVHAFMGGARAVLTPNMVFVLVKSSRGPGA